MGNERWYLDYCNIPSEYADTLFDQCMKLDFLDHPKIVGTQSRCKRNVGVYSNTSPGYRISKSSDYIIPASPLPDFLSTLLDSINSEFGENFNLFLVNEYASRFDSIGAHFDSSYGYGKFGVATLSLGATRIYRLRSRETGKIAMDYEMKHGDVLIMSNDFQLLYEHEIPPSEIECGTRFSLTTRHIVKERDFKHKRVREGPYRPRPLKICLVCQLSTDARSGVCADCYDLQKFECPQCKQKTGAPWLCNLCYVDKKRGVANP